MKIIFLNECSMCRKKFTRVFDVEEKCFNCLLEKKEEKGVIVDEDEKETHRC